MQAEVAMHNTYILYIYIYIYIYIHTFILKKLAIRSYIEYNYIRK